MAKKRASKKKSRGSGEKDPPGVKSIKGTRLLAETLSCTTRVLVHQGGTRSSKTYSIAQAIAVLFIYYLSRGERKTITIARKRMPSLKSTAMKDVLEIFRDLGIYDERFHNKTDHVYKIGGVEIEFLSTDDPQKIRGRKRDILWLNEANEFSYEDFLQFSLRTTEKIIIDYNPSDEYHWIYDYVLTRDDVTFIRSTFRDNPFLGAETVREIMRLKDIDPVAWQVYGEGQRGASVATIFPNFEIVDEMPEGQSIYGLDFGYNEPSAFVEVRVVEDEVYLNLLFYQRKLTNSDIGRKVKDLIQGSWEPVYCDSANPDRVEELWRMGLNVHPADKKPYSVKAGIDFMKRHKIHVTSSSEALIKELRHYKWLQDRDGAIMDMPMKQNDHAIDAARYAIYTHFGRPVSWLMADDTDGAAYHIIDES